MDIHVIAVGIEAAPLHGHTAVPLTLPAEAPADAVLDLIDDLHGDAVALLPAGRLEPGLRRLRVLQSALDGRARIATAVTGLSPLAAHAVASLTASVAPHAPSAALLADALPRIERELLVASVVGSVATLRSPRPTVGARLRSLLPGARYLVSSDPDPVVAPLHGRHAAPVLLDDPAGEVAVLASGRLRGLDLDALLATTFGGAPVTELDAPASLVARRGTPAVEAVAYPVDPVAAARRVLALPTAPCPWCAAPHASVPCALCGHDRDRALAAVGVPA